MNLRKLKQKDAPFMLEWMHDETIIENMKTNFASKTIEDCKAFIKMAQDYSSDLHLAITDDKDIYMGTVSLKHIKDGVAEFAIAVRKSAMGQGYSKFAMTEIIKIGFNKLKLNMIYWCVSPDNKRAIRFYDKEGYNRVNGDLLCIGWGGGRYSQEQTSHYIWYQETI